LRKKGKGKPEKSKKRKENVYGGGGKTKNYLRKTTDTAKKFVC